MQPYLFLILYRNTYIRTDVCVTPNQMWTPFRVKRSRELHSFRLPRTVFKKYLDRLDPLPLKTGVDPLVSRCSALPTRKRALCEPMGQDQRPSAAHSAPEGDRRRARASSRLPDPLVSSFLHAAARRGLTSAHRHTRWTGTGPPLKAPTPSGAPLAPATRVAVARAAAQAPPTPPHIAAWDRGTHRQALPFCRRAQTRGGSRR